MSGDRDLRDRLLDDRAALPTNLLRRLGGGLGAAWLGRRVGRDPGEEDLAAFVGAVGRLKGIAMKAGQIMSYIDVALPDETRAALAALQTHSQPMDADTVQRVVHEELGDDADALLAQLEPRPVAAASIGQVHRARLDGASVAVKVQYPEVRAAIESDFAAARVGPLMAGLVFPGARVDGLVAEAKARFLEECDYRHEARAQERFRAALAGDPVLFVPAVHQRHSAGRVLTTDFVDGLSFRDLLASDPDQATRDRFGEALFRFYVGSLFRHGLYNCDPHPGNYVFTGDRIAMLDHGCVREYEPERRAALAALTRAVHAGDDEALRDALRQAGFAPAAWGRSFADAKAFLRAFHGPMLEPGRRRVRLEDRLGLQGIVASKRRLLRVGVPGDFLFLLRIRFGLLSILSELGAEADWCALEAEMVGAD